LPFLPYLALRSLLYLAIILLVLIASNLRVGITRADSRGSAGASDKDRHHRRRDVASHFDGLAKGEPRVSSMVPIPTEADEEARRVYRE
jgi:hypothetical protein